MGLGEHTRLHQGELAKCYLQVCMFQSWKTFLIMDLIISELVIENYWIFPFFPALSYEHCSQPCSAAPENGWQGG